MSGFKTSLSVSIFLLLFPFCFFANMLCNMYGLYDYEYNKKLSSEQQHNKRKRQQDCELWPLNAILDIWTYENRSVLK